MPNQQSHRVIAYTPPFDWEFFLQYFGQRAVQGVEWVSGNTYCRTITVHGLSGWIELQPGELQSVKPQPSLRLMVCGPVSRHADFIATRIRWMLDLDRDLRSVHEALRQDIGLRDLLNLFPALRIPGSWSRFEMLVRTIVGQQVTVKAATTIVGRIVSRFGTPLSPFDAGAGSVLFPTPAALAEADWSGIGMPGKRAATIQNLAKAIHQGEVSLFDDNCDSLTADQRESLKAALLRLPGIGPWTVEYFSLRGLADTNAWPGSDLVLKREMQRLATQSITPPTQRMQLWEPYRGYAALLLWNQATDSLSHSRNGVAGVPPFNRLQKTP